MDRMPGMGSGSSQVKQGPSPGAPASQAPRSAGALYCLFQGRRPAPTLSNGDLSWSVLEPEGLEHTGHQLGTGHTRGDDLVPPVALDLEPAVAMGAEDHQVVHSDAIGEWAPGPNDPREVKKARWSQRGEICEVIVSHLPISTILLISGGRAVVDESSGAWCCPQDDRDIVLSCGKSILSVPEPRSPPCERTSPTFRLKGEASLSILE